MSWLQAGSSLLGGILSDRATARQTDKNIGMQTEFAKNAVQWKVEDAKKAGVHPLFALGANTTSFSPVPVTGSATGDAIARGGAAIAKSMSESKMKKLQTDLVEAQIQESRSRSIAALAQAKATNAEADFVTKQAIESAHRRDTQLKINDIPITKDTSWSDTQDMEDRYGDVAGALYGIAVGGADFIKTQAARARAYHDRMEDIALKNGYIYVRSNNQSGMGMYKATLLRKSDMKPVPVTVGNRMIERWNR